jgi:hypothetical protein
MQAGSHNEADPIVEVICGDIAGCGVVDTDLDPFRAGFGDDLAMLQPNITSASKQQMQPF